MDASEKERMDTSRMFFAEDLQANTDWMAKVISTLSDDVYVTVDLDVFDPAVMPSTGTPEPGGLGWYQMMQALAGVIRGRRVVGFDVVELAPVAGLHAPDYTVARLIYNFFGMISRNSDL